MPVFHLQVRSRNESGHGILCFHEMGIVHMTKILQYVNNKHRAGLHWYLSNPISHWKEVSRMNILDDLWYFIFHHGNIIKKDSWCLQHHGNGGCKSNGKMKNLCNKADISRYRLTKPEICVILIEK